MSEPIIRDATRRADVLAAFSRMSDSEWRTFVMFFQDQLVGEQDLLWDLLRERADKLRKPEQTTLSAVRQLMVSVGLKLST